MTHNPQDSAVALEVERAAFEAEMAKRSPGCDFTRFNKDNYTNGYVHNAWEGWQARASQADGTSGGWISVDEQLPAVNEKVMFYRAEGWCFGWRIGETEWADDSFQDRDGYPSSCYGVTHWMPLPSAPNQSQGENHVG